MVRDYFHDYIGYSGNSGLVFAFGEHGDARVRGFAYSALLGLLSYVVWITFQSRNSN
jgi:hypothetical protein